MLIDTRNHIASLLEHIYFLEIHFLSSSLLVMMLETPDAGVVNQLGIHRRGDAGAQRSVRSDALESLDELFQNDVPVDGATIHRWKANAALNETRLNSTGFLFYFILFFFKFLITHITFEWIA